ncbi:MAG: type IIA DNA topoisomerase subunit B [Candidatus Micrarchaeota archaeon]|nr:type IIA DNA topoisomerase subunit B [Candidatus Micrarchaeota archaeon]
MEELQDEYNASKIVVLEGTQGVRKRPAMYIGSTGPSGVLHLLFEALDNAVDEAMAGHCKNITITLSANGTGEIAEISDDGRGIPIDIMPKYNKPAVEVIMTSLHAGGKFNNDVYKTAGGLHGVGLTVINSLSEFTEVRIKKGGKEYLQTFAKGATASELRQVGETKERGTSIKFKPDPEIFVTPAFDATNLTDRLMYTSFLNPGLRLRLVDNRSSAGEAKEFYSEKGLIDFEGYINGGVETITPVMHFKKQQDNATVEIAIQYNKGYDERIESFVNNIRTTEGGTHVIGFRSGFSRAIINYANKSGQLEKRDVKLSGDDVREGLTAIVNILMQNPEFEGQTKEKLGNPYVKGAVENVVYSSLSRYLEEHPSEGRIIIEKVINAAVARESARKAKEMVRKRSIFESAVLPGKLADCIEGDPEKAEIFIVEGESAGGSSKQGRDKKFQAILPLKGKILNVEKASAEKIFDNAEIHTMVAAFGTGIRDSFNVEKIRYKKIILMSDADVDGSHIRTLLLTFLYRYLKPVVENGYVYIAQPPLYKVAKGKEVTYCYSDQELNAKMQQYDGKAAVQRYKGLGEMNPEQLWETTMDPQNRVLKRIQISDALKADELFTILMGMDVAKRRKFLEEHATEVKFLDV